MTTARTATPSTARAINDRLALDLLLERGPLTASDLRALTGLSRPTVADLLERLQRSGLVAHAGESAALRRGPNARLYGLVADRAYLAGIDIRANGVSLVVADLTGRTLGTATIAASTPASVVDAHGGPADGDQLVERTVEALLATAAEAGAGELHTVAVGAPGLVDPTTGALNNSGKLPEWHTKLLAALRARPGTEVILENEVNLAGIAEHRIGAAQGRRDFALIWLGHGVGASVVLDGRLRRGPPGAPARSASCPYPGPSVCRIRRSATTASTPRCRARRSANSPPATGSRSRSVPVSGPAPGLVSGARAEPEPGAWPRTGNPPPRPWSAGPSRPAPTTSWTNSHCGSPSGPPRSASCSTRDAWCWAARSDRPAAPNWPVGSNAISPGSPRLPPRCGPVPRAAAPSWRAPC